MASSQFAPPNAIVISGWACLTRAASASDAMFCWNTDVKPTSV